LRDQRELLAAVSHEIRTPLTRIRLLLELSREGVDAEKNLAEIDSEVVEIDALVGDLLASARMDFSALAPRPLRADEIARRAVERSSIPGVKVDVPEAPGSLEADATLVSRALAALLDNAKKYGGERVVLRVQTAGDRVTFAVDDDGHGFEAGDEERVFEAFYRGNGRAQNEPRGIGLGLALVRRIAEAHGGRAYAQNLPSGGARVAIELPRGAVANGSAA
jgi:signal transduction histidine kinase